MELQQLTEQMLLAVTSLNRSCIPQRAAHGGDAACSRGKGDAAPLHRLLRPAACRSAYDRSRPTNGGAGARVAVRACAVCAPTARRARHAGIDSAFEPHHGDRGTRLSRGCARI